MTEVLKMTLVLPQQKAGFSASALLYYSKKMIFRNFFLWVISGMLFMIMPMAFAAEIDKKEAREIGVNFLTYLGENHTIGETKPLEQSGQTVGYLMSLNPQGYILVSGNTIRIPVKAYSLRSDFDSLPPAYVQTLLDELHISTSPSSKTRFSHGGVNEAPEAQNNAYWNFLTQPSMVSRKTYAYTPDTWLLTTKWNQTYPYNRLNPKYQDTLTITGCVQTALAQIMRYHGHPSSGSGVFTHTRNGQTLTAVMNRPFNWSAMPHSVNGGVEQYQQEEVAALMRDLGILNQANFGTGGTSASFYSEKFERAFGYAPISTMESGNADFFTTIVNEINNERPVILSMPNHMTVADGYASDGTGKKIHINLGWGGSNDDFYYLDQTNIIGDFAFTPNHTIYYNIKPCQAGECSPYPPESTTNPPIIASDLNDMVIEAGHTLRIDTYDPDGDSVTLSATSSCDSLQSSVNTNRLTLTPGSPNMLCEITATAQSQQLSVTKAFKVLVLEKKIHLGTEYDMSGTFADRSQVDEHKAYLEGYTVISGNRGYGNQAFYIWAKDAGGNLAIPASESAVSGNLTPGIYTVGTSLTNPFTRAYYTYDPDFAGYSLSVTDKDLTQTVSGLADSLGIALTQDDTPSPAGLTQTQVSQLYVSIFGRTSEGEGNAYWCANQNNMELAAETMLATGAAKIYFGSTLNDNQQFIEFIYENTLGKTYAEDPAGVDYWVSELLNGKSKATVITTLINAVMDTRYTGLASQDQFINKVIVCNYTADEIPTVPDVNDLSAFIGFISNVTHDSQTVVEAKAKVKAFF